MHRKRCDVFVAGTGIAGVMAALEAAKTGKKVILAGSGPLFSGSSFYPGTWGLGVVTPDGRIDEENLVQTILRVGCGVAEETLVRAFVKAMLPTMEELESEGFSLMTAREKTEREFIPCFDYKNRGWYGLKARQAKTGFYNLLIKYGVECMECTTILGLRRLEERVCGAVVSVEGRGLCTIDAKAVVLATGGYGSLFAHTLTTKEQTGMGHFLALEQGCHLVNMEFMQMMPGFLVPGDTLPTVFNEKAFRCVETEPENHIPKELWEMRAGYGPFTSRLPSREIDFWLSAHHAKVKYSSGMQENTPELIRTYFQWLEKEKGIKSSEAVELHMYAHAANGGILIKEDASTERPGLFACGEVTGGMHGADRIGGLSTMNGFVFGKKAGQSAAAYANTQKHVRVENLEEDWYRTGIADCDKVAKELGALMTEQAMLFREEAGLLRAAKKVEGYLELAEESYAASVESITESRILMGKLHVALAILKAQAARRESRGSHFRADYPAEDNSMQNKRVVCKMEQKRIEVKIEQKVK